jgi:hypothetical protein
MFFKKYYYKVELEVPCGHFVRDYSYRNFSKSSFIAYADSAIERTIKSLEANGGSSSLFSRWNQSRLEDLEAADVDQLAELYVLKKSYPAVRTRIEGSSFHIYTHTAQELTDILDSSTHIRDAIMTIHCPGSEEAKTQLGNKVIFLKNPKYKYRVNITEHKYSRETLTQLHNYIANFPDDIKLTPAIRDRMRPTLEYDAYLYGYFYVNDLSVLTFMKMISHKFVKEIFTIEQAPL